MKSDISQKDIRSAQLIDLYKTYVDTITANEHRRYRSSFMYFSLCAAGFTVAGSIGSIDPIVPTLMVVFISIVWCMTIKSFRQLAKAKFEVIKEMESELCYQPFERERKIQN